MSRSVADWWKSVATAAVTGLAFVVYHHFVEARDYATRTEAAQITETQGPYVRERESILHQLKSSGDQLTALNQSVQASTQQIAELRAEVRTLSRLLEDDRASK